MNSSGSIDAKRIRRWFGFAGLAIFLLFCILILPTLWRKSRLIAHIEDVGGFFYSYHSPEIRKLLGRNHRKIRNFLVPKIEPLLGKNWPGIFKEITHVGIDLRHGGTEWNLNYLSHQAHVIWVDIGELRINDDEIEVLKTLPKLASLKINITNVTPQGIIEIARLESVRHLVLVGRKPGDEEIESIINMKELKTLSLGFPDMDHAGKSPYFTELRRKHPDLNIIPGPWFRP